MSSVVWIGEEFAIQGEVRPMEGVNYMVVGEDNFERYYSKFGFAVPLSTSHVSYCAVMEDRVPKFGDHLDNVSSNVSWMVIDHFGEVWQVDYFFDENTPKISVFSTPAGKVNKLAMATREPDMEMLAGFIAASQNKDALQKFVFDRKIGGGYRQHWFTLSDVVAKLNKDYPRE